MKILLLFLLLFSDKLSSTQTKFKLSEQETDSASISYSLIDEHNQIIKTLSSEKYYTAFFGMEYGFFVIVGIKGTKGWSAINEHEEILFQVYNTSKGTPSPDHLIENKIRIIDDHEKIGFADDKGEIIIEPQFEMVTSFYNGYAIIGAQCDYILWGNHEQEEECNHYSVHCEKHGYINAAGEVIKVGNYSFEEIKEEIDWRGDQ